MYNAHLSRCVAWTALGDKAGDWSHADMDTAALNWCFALIARTSLSSVNPGRPPPPQITSWFVRIILAQSDMKLFI